MQEKSTPQHAAGTSPASNGQTPPPLAETHLTMLRDASAISPEVIAERGYQSLDGRDGYAILKSHGFTKGQAENTPGLLLPVWGTDGQRTPLNAYRPDTPRAGSTRKYEIPRGRGMRLDVPPRCHKDLDNPHVPLWITEGQKKGDAIASKGGCVVVLLGVDCWRGTNAKEGKTALVDWEYVALNQRRVYICFDSDLTHKKPVQNAMHRLARFLASKGAEVIVAHQPTSPLGDKWGIDDFLAAGHTLQEALQVTSTPEQSARESKLKHVRELQAHLPKIELAGGTGHVTAKEAEDAFMAWQEHAGPVLFQRAGQLCCITRDQASEKWLKRPPELPMVQTMPSHKLRGLLGLVATWWKFDARTQDLIQIDPPLSYAHTLLEQGEWPFPPLRRIATRPFLRADLTLCLTPGYDPASGVFLELNGTALPTLPPEPDIFAAQASWNALQALWQNFPFATKRDQAATLAALLTLIARSAIEGSCPLFAFVSSTPGSGKGLLADTLCLIATGYAAPRWMMTRDDEEMRKQLMTMALAGEQIALMDNVQYAVGGEALDGILTSATVYGRLMGTQERIRAHCQTVMMLTGNNVTYRGDTIRRVLQITLQPEQERPEERTDFAEPRLRAHVQEQQYVYLAHALTILLAYLADGAPPPGKAMGSFEEWNDLVRGCVLWVTGIDPIEGQAEQTAQDENLTNWMQVLDAWYACLGEQARTLAQVKNEMEDVERRAQAETKAQADARTLGKTYTRSEEAPDTDTVEAWRTLRMALAAMDWKGDGTRLNMRVIGKAFSAMRNRIFHGSQMVQAGKDGHQTILWRVKPVAASF